MAVRTIDVSALFGSDAEPKRALAREWDACLKSVGFAIIVGHNVPESVETTLYDAAKQFFHLPEPDKLKAALNARQYGPGGYVTKGAEAVARSTGEAAAHPDIIENFVFHDGARGPAAAVAALPEAFRQAAEEYWRHLSELTRKLMELCALALDLPEDYFAPFYTKPSYYLKLSNYPVPSEEERLHPRYGAHTDYQGLTILRQDPFYHSLHGGLEILNDEGAWVRCPVIPRSFVVNVGDLLERWTNNRWRSDVHRVAPCGMDEDVPARLVCVFFTGPNLDSHITPLPTCGEPKYPPMSAGDHLYMKLARSNVNKD